MNLQAAWWQRSIGARLVALFLALLLAVQVASFASLRASLADHAQRTLPTKLMEGDRVLQSLLDRRAQTLIDGARLLAADYGFREALASNDDATIVSVLGNQGARIGATQTALLATDFRLRSTTAAGAHDLLPVIDRLATQAAQAGQASTVALLAGRPYQAVLVPVKAPVVVGWVLMAFPLDAQIATDMMSLSSLNLTLLARSAPAQPWRVALTSLDAPRAAALAAHGWSDATPAAPMAAVQVRDDELGIHARSLGQAVAAGAPGAAGVPGNGAADAGVMALLSLSVDDAVRLPHDLQLALIAITIIGIAVFALGSVFTARSVTAPLRLLAAAAERLGAGDCETPMRGLRRHDEIGELAQSFERMRVNVAEKQQEILQLAYWDGLTGLPNRVRFREVLAEALHTARAAAPDGQPPAGLAVVMLDLNRFKHVNDVLGYRFGDLLLVRVAERLSRELLREGDFVARLSGDEFGVLLRGADAQLALAVALRIERAFDVPLLLEEHHVDMGAGIGVACSPQHADDADTLLNRAEVAMYTAKRRGSGPVLYEPSIDVASAQTLTLMTELRHAVEHGELRLYLQPKLSLDKADVVGAEALVRWQHPVRGLVPPFQFIPFAEQTGFIRVLTIWIFEEAARHWQALADEGLELLLSVNLSTRDLLDPELPLKFDALLRKHGVPATGFCLEITESAIMDDPQRALATLDRLSAMGFKLSIDDFGTGYSSLAYLSRLPVDELKIDQSFVRNMHADNDDAMIVRSTIDLAHNLGILVVAEGVETAQVWDMLRELHCDQAQGYHMGRPMPIADFPSWSNRWIAARGVRLADSSPLLH